MKKNILLVFLMVMVALNAFTQWSNDPMVNTIVNNMSGEQAVPHVAYDANGNFYVGFYSNSSGNYDIRLHYFNYDGEAQWDANGLLVSGNTQNSWVTEWDLTTDTLGNCVLAFNDVRDGNANVYAYCISPSGSFLWGANGIGLTTAAQDEYVPSITVTADNNTIVAWSRPTSPHSEIVMQKITPGGTLSWGSGGITYQAGSENYTGARVLGVEDDNFILAFYKETGNFPALTRHIYAQKFDINGDVLWAENGILAISLNTYIPYPKFNFSDNNSMIICHQANTTGFVAQKVLDDGTVAWDEDGNLICTTTYSPFYEEHVEVQTGDKTIAVWAKTQQGGGSNDIYITRVDDNEVSGEKELAIKQLQVFPNPASSEFTVVLPENLNGAHISLIDSFGKEIFRASQSSISTNQKIKISTSELPVGIYFVKIQSGGETYSEKLVVK